jgi:hypothetical protein
MLQEVFERGNGPHLQHAEFDLLGERPYGITQLIEVGIAARCLGGLRL